MCIRDRLLGEVGDDGGFAGGDGDDHVIHPDDAKRHGGVAVAIALGLHVGAVHDDAGLVAVALDAGALLLVQRGLDIGRVQREKMCIRDSLRAGRGRFGCLRTCRGRFGCCLLYTSRCV